MAFPPVSGQIYPLIGSMPIPLPEDRFIYDLDSLVDQYRDEGFELVHLRNRIAEYLDLIDEFGFSDDPERF
jgi:hypothetical protein